MSKMDRKEFLAKLTELVLQFEAQANHNDPNGQFVSMVVSIENDFPDAHGGDDNKENFAWNGKAFAATDRVA